MELMPAPPIIPVPLRAEDLTEKTFGALTVIGYVGKRSSDSFWLVECPQGHRKLSRKSVLKGPGRRQCPRCPKLLGNKHPEWEGVGELSKNLFNTYVNGAKARDLPFEVSIEYMWRVFEEQDRKCALTGWSITFNESYKMQTERTASPDRIDSSKGYIEGNLRWVHRDVNKLKKNMGDARFFELCKAIVAKQKGENK